MAIDLSMDMGELFKSLMQPKEGEAQEGSASGVAAKLQKVVGLLSQHKSILIFTGVCIVTIVLALYLLIFPLTENIAKKQKKIGELNAKKEKIIGFEAQIAAIKKKIDTSKEEYIASLSKFGNSNDLGDMYNTISNLATRYELIIQNIQEQERAQEEPKKNTAAQQPQNGEQVAETNPADEVEEIKVKVDLKGSYGAYIKFKEDLAVADMLLNVNSEEIKVGSKSDEGGVIIKLDLSTYAIDKQPYQGVM